MDDQEIDESEVASKLVYMYGTTANGSLAPGSSIVISDGYAGVMVANRAVWDVVAPGNYVLDERCFPLFAQKFGLANGELRQNRLGYELLLVNTGGAEIPWYTHEIPIKTRESGLNYCKLTGYCQARIVDPIAFYKSYVKGWVRMGAGMTKERAVKRNAMSLDTRMDAFIRYIINMALSASLRKTKNSIEVIRDSPASLEGVFTPAVKDALLKAGVDCFAFGLRGAPQIWRPGCAKCQSLTVQTAYGNYSRVLGAIHFHVINSREGNFCVPCAAKISVGNNLLMLLAGWWSIGGIILSPFFLVKNCYYFLSTVFGPKEAATSTTIANAV